MHKILQTPNHLKIAIVAIPLLAVFATILLMAPHKTYASTLDDGTNIPTAVKDNLFYYCVSQPIDVAQATWISLAGQPSVTDVTINHRGDPVSLQFNVVVARCHSGTPTGIVLTSFRWTGGSYSLIDSNGNAVLGTTQIPTPSPANQAVNTPPTTGDNYSFASLPSFGVDTSNIVKPYVDVSLSVTSKQFNWFTSGNVLGCVVPPPPAPQNVRIPNIYSDYLCPDAPAGGTFRIYLANPPSPTVQDTCTGINYQAGDSNSVEIDGPGGQLATGLAPNGSFTLPSSISPGASLDIYGYGPDGTSHTTHVWTPPNSNCPATIVAVPGTTQLNPDAEAPTSAIFNPSFTYTPPRSASTNSLSGVSITCHYYVSQASTQTPLSPDDTNGNATLSPNYNCHDASSPTTDTRSIPSALNIKAGDKVCEHLSASVSAGSFDPSLGAGQLVVNPLTGTVISHGTPATLPTDYCVIIVNQPYVSIYGGDIQAGGVFDTSSGACSVAPAVGTGNIAGNINGTSLRGSGTQLAAFAFGQINKFNSASLSPPSPPAFSTGLDFSNSGTAPFGNFGYECIHNYYGDLKPTANPIPTGNFTIASTDTGQWSYTSGNLTITSGSIGSIANVGNHVEIYANGNITINSNITYQSTSWSSIDAIPSLYVIAKGNINIEHGVTQLDGVYIAEGGTINDCTSGGVAIANTALYGQCSSQLVVNGAFVASNVQLLRTTGSVRDTAGDPASSVPNSTPRLNCSNGSTSTNVCAAEVFNYNPEMWIIGLPGDGTNAQISNTYDYISALPPVL